jgi:hypothetical protein
MIAAAVCKPDTITCELHRLVAAQAGWDWAGFVSTLLATVVGAVIGILGVVLVARRDFRDRYDSRLDEAVVGLLHPLAEYQDGREGWHRSRWSTRVDSGDRHEEYIQYRLPRPSRAALDAARASVAVLAREADAVTFNAIDLLITRAENHDDEDDQGGFGYLHAMQVLTDWRSRSFTPEQIRRDAENWPERTEEATDNSR